MPAFVYVLLGIALLIVLLLLSKVRVFICYEDSLRIYAKFLFLKFSIIPTKEKKPKKKKPKKTHVDTHPQEQVSQPTKEKSITKKLWELRNGLFEIIKFFLGKLHFRFIKLRINIACENAAKTALLYAGANQGIAYILETLRNISNVDVAKNSDVYVNADFISQKSEFESKIELYIRVAPLISVGIHALKEYIKLKSTKED